MASQDFPLDLSVKKTEEYSTDHEGVLDLSTKSRCNSASSFLRTSHGSTVTPIVKSDLTLAKARDLQSASTLEQFMAKLCLHHQRQIVDALDFLQTEVKKDASTHSLSTLVPASPSTRLAEVESSFGCNQLNVVPNTHESPILGPPSVRNLSSSELYLATQGERDLDNAGKLCLPTTHPDFLDLCKVSSEGKGDDIMLSLPDNSGDRENACCNAAASINKSENFSHIVNSSSILKPGNPVVSTLEEQQCNPETSLHQSNSSGRLIQSLVRHNQGFDNLYDTGRSSTHGNAKDMLVGLYPVRKTSKTVSIVSLKKARKSGRMPSQPSTPFYQTATKYDNNYDIVYVGKSITECELQHQRRIPLRQNARKSTRGHKYFRDCWELKTVRTLYGKSYINENGDYSAMMPQTTPVTPIQLLSKPDGVPPVDIQFAGGCEEAISQKEPVEESTEREMIDDDMAESSLMLEPIQTDHAVIKEQVSSPTLSSMNQQNSKTTEQEEAALEMEMEMEISAQNSVKSADKENNQKQSGTIQEKEEVQEIQLQEALSDPADITHNGSRSDILSVKESQPDISEPIQSLPAEHSDIQGDHLGNMYDKEVQCQKPQLVENLAENMEYTAPSNESDAKENANNPEMGSTELVCQAVGETGPQLHGLVSSRIVDKETVKEFDIVFENSEEDCVLKEVVMNTQGSITTKTGSGKYVSTSDRCLRSRTKASNSESLIKTPKQIKDPCNSNISENFEINSPLRVVSVKHQEGESPQLGVNHSEALEKAEILDYTVQPSSEFKPSEFHVDGPVWTRQKHKSVLAKKMENHEAIQGQAVKDALQLQAQRPDKGEISKMCTATPSRVMEDPFNCDSIGGDMEISGKMSSNMFCRNGGMSAKSGRSVIPLKQDFGSQRFVTPRPNDNERRVRHVKTGLQKCIQTQRKDSDPFGLQKLDLSGSNPHKFLETLTEEKNQRLITDLNSKYDKMQRGWVQMDRAGQHTTGRHKNKADRLKEIWKSKRRVRKPKSLDKPASSPVRHLFMKTFDMSSICQWFLQTTETKSLVIIKKANTRLPSETQLCFQGSSGVPSSSQGVFPSLQAERLKKHLKKFAIASPVKSNPKNRKLISKVWEQEGGSNKGKEKVNDLTTAGQVSTKLHGLPHKLETQVMENQKATVGSRRPASARILRKYSSIRGKLQVQPPYVKPKGMLEEDARLRLKNSPKPVPSSKLLEQKKKGLSVGEDRGSNASKSRPSSRRLAGRTVCTEKGVKKNNRSSTGLNKKDDYGLKRCSLSSAAQKLSRAAAHHPVSSRLKSKAVVAIKAEKEPVEVPKAVKKVNVQVREAKVQPKKLVRNMERLTSRRKIHVSPAPQDHVLTRSQRKTEATSNTSVLSKSSTKQTQDLVTSSAKRTRTSL